MQRPKTRSHTGAADDEPAALRGYLPHHLARLLNALNLRLLEHLRPLDLTQQQFRVMQILDARDTASVGEIARDTAIEQPVISRIVDQLETRAYAERTRRCGNARIVDVRLTKSGRDAFGGLKPLVLAIVDDAFGELSDAEKGLLERVLKRAFDSTIART